MAIDNCPNYNIDMNFVGLDKLSLLDYEDKVACVLFFKQCNFRCPFCHNGLTVINSDYYIEWDEVLSYLKSRKGIMDAVVISGGEPTLMPDLKDKIKDIKAMGLLVKLDTNGTNPEVVEDLYKEKLIDYIAMDIKNCPMKYAITTGIKSVDMERIKRTVNFIINCGIEYEFRTTLVDEFHDCEDMYGLGEMIKGAKKIYLQKFIEREGCFEKGLHAVSKDKADGFKILLEKYVKEVNLRGY